VSASDRDLQRAKRTQVADAIIKRRGDIDTRWLDRVAKTLPRGDVSTSELRDSMPVYLLRLAEGLRNEGTVELGGASSWTNVAREHAETRVDLGFDIDHLVREFIVLRQVLEEVLEEEHVLTESRQAELLADLIEGAIAAAVKSYVDSRDFQIRKQEAEHIGFIAHELRTPLTNAALGIVQLRRSSNLPQDQGRVLSLVERNLRRLAELIDGVLLVERDAHALKPQLAQISLRKVFEDTVSAAKLAAEAKGLHLETHFDPDVVVQVDPRLTASAIDNVVQNALKYTDEGGIDLDVEDHVGEVVVHVRDSGPGLSHQDLLTIFEPFRRGDSGTGKVGSGLGLAIARRAIEVQGGTIHVESEQGRGSHFWLTLPKPRT
jgi:signal transduction histidine kinase